MRGEVESFCLPGKTRPFWSNRFVREFGNSENGPSRWKLIYFLDSPPKWLVGSGSTSGNREFSDSPVHFAPWSVFWKQIRTAVCFSRHTARSARFCYFERLFSFPRPMKLGSKRKTVVREVFGSHTPTHVMGYQTWLENLCLMSIAFADHLKPIWARRGSLFIRTASLHRNWPFPEGSSKPILHQSLCYYAHNSKFT